MKGHMDPVSRRSKICFVCKSPYCDEIENRVLKGESKKEIVKWLKKKDPETKIKEINIRRHVYHKHGFKFLQIKEDSKEEVEKKEHNISKSGRVSKKKNIKVKESQVKSLVEFLDLVIDRVVKDINEKKLEPTVTEGIKAAEIKAKIKESSRYEKELISFFMEMSLSHEYHH